MKRFKLAGGLLVAGLFAASTSYGAVVSGTFNVTSATLNSLYSATLDGPCTLNPGGSFFTCNAGAGFPAPAVVINNLGGGSGTITLKYDDVTGDVTEITDLLINVNDMILNITSAALGSATVTVTQGNMLPVANDFPFLRSGTGAPSGSADSDQDATVGVFRHDAPGSEQDATDFATFTDIVDSCVGAGVCALIPVLAIDGLRYEIQGLVAGGMFNGTLRSETSNNSNYFVSFQSTVVPAPPAVWLLLTGIGALAARRFRRPR